MFLYLYAYFMKNKRCKQDQRYEMGRRRFEFGIILVITMILNDFKRFFFTFLTNFKTN